MKQFIPVDWQNVNQETEIKFEEEKKKNNDLHAKLYQITEEFAQTKSQNSREISTLKKELESVKEEISNLKSQKENLELKLDEAKKKVERRF